MDIDSVRLEKAKLGRGYVAGGYNLAQLRSLAKLYSNEKPGYINQMNRQELYDVLIEQVNVNIEDIVQKLKISKGETPIEVVWFVSLTIQSYPWILDGEEIEYEVIRPFSGLLCEMVDKHNKDTSPYPMVVIEDMLEDENHPERVVSNTAYIIPIIFTDIVEQGKGIVIEEDERTVIYLDYSTGKWYSPDHEDYDIIFGKETQTFKALNAKYKYVWEQQMRKNIGRK